MAQANVSGTRPSGMAVSCSASGGTAPDAPGARVARLGALWKLQREMQEQRRKQREGDRVTPVEHPVQAIERATEGEAEDTEECDAEPEEVQRRLIVRAAKPNRRANQQG